MTDVGTAISTEQRVVVGGVAALAILPVVLAPVQSVAWRLGAPDLLVRALLGAPDVALVAIVVAGFTAAWRSRRPLDRVDVVAAAFVALVLAYFAIDLVGRAFGFDVFGSAPDDLEMQALAARAAIACFLLFVAIRGVAVPRRSVERLLDVVLVSAVVLAVGALVEAVFPNTWERLGNDVLHYRRLQRDVYGVDAPPTLITYTYVGDRKLVRSGSFLFEYLQLGFLLLPGLAIALLRVTRRPRWIDGIALVLVSGAILATVSRAAIGASVLVVAAVWLTRVDATERRRIRRLVVAAVAVVVLTAVPTGLAARLVATADVSDDSTPVHVDSTMAAVRQIVDAPLGIGLGTGAATSARLPRADTIVSENAYLDVALQVGVVGGLFQLSALGLIVLHLVRAERSDIATVSLATGVAMAAGGLVLHTWQMVETTWLFFALAGLALPREVQVARS